MTEETPDPMERITAALTDAVASVTASLETRLAERDEQMRTLINERIPAAPAPLPERDAKLLPGARAGATDRVTDQWTAAGYTRSDFELATMIADSARTMARPVELSLPDHFKAAARWHMFEDPKGQRPMVLGDGGKVRAMDSAETLAGLELIGVEYSNSLWEAARNLDTLVGDIRVVPMATSTMKVPINGGMPEVVLAPENTSSANTFPTTVPTPSNNVTLTAKKFAVYQAWSAELEEDSVIAFVPFLRDMLSMSYAAHLGSAYLNGDLTDAGTGNINLDDANPADTKHYLAWDGIRHDWLITTTANGINQAAALNPNNINVARGKLNQGDDALAALTNINWGLNPRNLRLVMDWDTYLAMLDAEKVTTVDKYGSQATVITGELGSYAGIPIITPGYAVKTEADGRQSTTETNNTKGQITLFAPAAYLAGSRRGVQFFMDRVQGRDQFLIELYFRHAFTRFGTAGAAGIFNITL